MGFRESIPASLQEILQNGLLEGIFGNALLPLTLFDTISELKPWGGGMGSTSIMTRSGLMVPNTTPATGSDAGIDNYGFEQYTMTMDQYGRSIDTNMAVSAMALASKFLQDNKTLGIQASQSINLLARNALYGAYAGGTTYATASSTTSTALVVADVTGFSQAVALLSTANGNAGEGLGAVAVPTAVPVSGAAPLTVTVNAVANTVTGVAVGVGQAAPGGTLTLGSAVSASIGWAVLSAVAPVQYRPNARVTNNALVSGDIATFSLFQSAVTRLRNMNVPTINGAYTAFITPNTLQELYQDQNFLLALRGRYDSAAYANFTLGQAVGDNVEFLGRFSGIDWFSTTLVPTVTNVAGLTVYRPIVVGAEALIKGPFERMADLVAELNAGSTVQVDMVAGVARILRAPLDRFGQILSSTWSWIGGYSVSTDLLTGDSAIYKRACVVEHI